MSKKLIIQLNKAYDSGDLFIWVDEIFAASQLLPKLGYAKSVSKYCPIIKQFLLDKDFDISHWTPNGLPPAKKYKIVCVNCNNLFIVFGESKKNQKTCSYNCATEKYRKGSNNVLYTTGISTYREQAITYYGCKCNKCGIENIDLLQVHHKDRNRFNNNIQNLEVLCANCHVLEHRGIT